MKTRRKYFLVDSECHPWHSTVCIQHTQITQGALAVIAAGKRQSSRPRTAMLEVL